MLVDVPPHGQPVLEAFEIRHAQALLNKAEAQRIKLSQACWALSEALRNYREHPCPAHFEAISTTSRGLEFLA